MIHNWESTVVLTRYSILTHLQNFISVLKPDKYLVNNALMAYHSHVRPVKFIIAGCIFLMLFNSCTKEVDTPIEINGINTTVNFIISPLSQEISGNFQSEREVCIYGSHSNYIIKSSPVYKGITKGESNKSIIHLNNVESHALYLRVNIWHRYYANNRVFYRSFYYVDSIPIPDYKCNVEVRIEKGRWIQE